MKRVDLEKLELSKEVIDQVMAMNGKDIESVKAKIAAIEQERETLKNQLTEANQQRIRTQNNPSPVVSDIETYLNHTGFRHEVREAYEEINKVHRSACRYRISVIDSPEIAPLGFLKIINNEPALISLRPNGDTPMLTAIHEAGHFLDISGIDEIGKMAEDKIGETLADWWSAITKAMHIMSW